MTELFARLVPGVDLKTARAELRTVYGAIKRQHPEDYPVKSDFRINAVKLRDELTSGARTILWVLMASSVLVFVIACSNAANLILARTIRRESELGIRAALGASAGALRRTLLAESLMLCVAGAMLNGVLIASPMVAVLARYISRYSVRALDLRLDPGMLWVGAGLAIVAAGLLAFVPRLPSSGGAQGFGLATASTRVTGAANRKLRVFAIVQIAASFVLVASAGATVKTLLSSSRGRADQFQHPQRARLERACAAFGQDARSDRGILPGGDRAHSPAAGRSECCHRHHGPLEEHRRRGFRTGTCR